MTDNNPTRAAPKTPFPAWITAMASAISTLLSGCKAIWHNDLKHLLDPADFGITVEDWKK